jgi:hypothetical protein
MDATTPTAMFKLPFTGSGLASPLVGFALATHPTTGQLWVSFTSAGTPRLGVVTVDLTAGQATIRGPSSATPLTTTTVLQAITFDSSGVLWATTNPNLDARGLPRFAVGAEVPATSKLYTVSTTNGAMTFRMDVSVPAFRGAAPYEIQSVQYDAPTHFLSDRETLVYDPSGNRLYRFGAAGLQSINPSTLAVTNSALSAFAPVPGEPRTIWGAVWGWPTAGRIGVTSPNLVYSLFQKNSDSYSISTTGNVQRAFSSPLLIETTSLAMADLGQVFRDRLWTQAMCQSSSACTELQGCFVSTSDNCLGASDNGQVIGGGIYWFAFNSIDASCKGRPGCRVWPDNCGQTATCGFAQCRGITTCIGGL